MSIIAAVLATVGIAIAKPAAKAAVEGIIEAVTKQATGKPMVITPTVIKDIVATNGAAIVPVKSAWASKINWVAGIALAFAAFDFFGHPIPADAQGAITKVVTTLTPLAIIVLRSWFNNSATK